MAAHPNNHDAYMLIQINTDRNVGSDSDFEEWVRTEIDRGLRRFSDRVTRVEVHFGDTNSDKKFGADDKRCMLEARLAGLRPIVVNHHAATPEKAVTGAVQQLRRSLDTTLGKLSKH